MHLFNVVGVHFGKKYNHVYIYYVLIIDCLLSKRNVLKEKLAVTLPC